MKARLSLAAVLAISFIALESRADDTSLEGLLSQEVVTSVSKSAESTQDAPALTRSISAEEIRRYGMTSVAEALDFLGLGVHVEQALGHSELTVRGIGFTGDRGNHVLVLLDGHTLNEPLIGDAPIDQRLGVPLEMIDHIELVLGPGSAMYGTNAVLAVVNVVTKSAKTMAGFHAVAEAGALGSLRSTLTTGQTFDLFGKRAAFTAGLTHYHLDSSIKLEPQTIGSTMWGGEAKNAFRNDVSGARMRLVRDGLEVSARVAVASAGEPAGISDFDHPDSGSLERRGNISISQRFSLGRFGDLTATVYGKTYANARRYIISRHVQCPFPGVATCDYRERESSNRLGADVRSQLDWLQDGRVVTALGTSASIDHVDADTIADNYATGGVLGPRTAMLDVTSVVNAAANGQQTLRPFTWLDLVAGGRIDWRRINDDDGETQVYAPVFTPRLALAARPWSGGTAKLIYAEAFRAPNPYEVDAEGPTLIHSQNLQPETTRTVEAAFEQHIDAHRFMVGAFRTEYHGIINRLLLTQDEERAAYLAGLTPILPDTNAPVYQYRVDDYLETHGFHAGFDGLLLSQRLHYGASFTGSVARADHVERVMTAPQWYGNARVAYDFGETLPTAALAASFAGNTSSDRAYDAGFLRMTFAPPSLEVRATLTGQVPRVKGLSYRVIVAHQRHERTPFAVGPGLRAQTGYEKTPLTPTQPWNAFLGLQYDFGD